MKTEDLDDETLAVQAVGLFDKAFISILEDLVKSKVDMRILTKLTRDRIMVARQRRDEIIRRRELKESKAVMPKGEKH